MILGINRDFPYQVALSFDKIAIEVLAWLDDRSFEWDMYVDLPASEVRYRFRSLADAAAFKQRFVGCDAMASCRRGQLIRAGRTRSCCRRGFAEPDGYNEIHKFCRDLTLCSRGHALYHDGQWFHVYCFKEAADAQKFMERFGGEKFDPIERGRGANWAR